MFYIVGKYVVQNRRRGRQYAVKQLSKHRKLRAARRAHGGRLEVHIYKCYKDGITCRRVKGT